MDGPTKRSEFLKRMQTYTDGRISPNFQKGNAGTCGPPIWSEFLKGDAGIHGPPTRSVFIKGDAGIHGPPIWSNF